MDTPRKTAELLSGSTTPDEIDSRTKTSSELPEPSAKDGRFKPGAEWRGNATGRSKGTKNRITLQRLLVEEELRETLAVDAQALLKKAVLMALDGNDKIMRTLLDKLMATPKNTEDESAKDTSINVTISDLSVASPQRVATVSRGADSISITPARIIEHKPSGE